MWLRRSYGLILLLVFSAVFSCAGENVLSVFPLRSGRLAVYPGSEGFGTDTRAGRGGIILHVTNLNDSGAGSLRAALEHSSPRIVVFDVGGVIRLQRDIKITSPYITLAGQTAPGDGIMIRDFGLRIRTHDVLIQHVAIRVGDDGRSRDRSWDNLDCLQILGGYNIVIDHVSASWGIDENMSVWGSNIHDLTVSHCLIAEGLRDSVHPEGPHSKGLLVGGGATIRRMSRSSRICSLIIMSATRRSKAAFLPLSPITWYTTPTMSTAGSSPQGTRSLKSIRDFMSET